MSLTNSDITDVINDCKLYNNIIERNSYIDPWVRVPKFTYNSTKKCRDLLEKRSTYHPVGRRDFMYDKFYNYKTNQPRESSGHGLRVPTYGARGGTGGGRRRGEGFGNNLIRTPELILLIIILILIIC